MPNYTTLLKTWGDTGSEYPVGYSYIEGEQPVDAWDNYLIHNVVKDLQSLIDTTNDDLLLRNGGSLLSDLAVGGYAFTGDAGSVSFSGTEVTVDAPLDVLSALDVSGDASVSGNASVAGNISVSATSKIDGVDLSSFKSDYDSHIHDGRYYTETESDGRFINDGDPVPHAVYATTGDVPALNTGETVVVGGDLYVEDGN